MSDSPVDIARASWGETLRDWVLRLAEECTRSSQAKVAAASGGRGRLSVRSCATNTRPDSMPSRR